MIRHRDEISLSLTETREFLDIISKGAEYPIFARRGTVLRGV
jgi:hypothetical protein